VDKGIEERTEEAVMEDVGREELGDEEGETVMYPVVDGRPGVPKVLVGR
jgi:hypothetical protein